MLKRLRVKSESQPGPNQAKLMRLMRNRYFFFFDVLLFVLTPVLSLALRNDGTVNLPEIWAGLVAIIVMFGVIKFLLFFVGGLYQQMWQHASVDELARIGLLGLLVMGGNVLSFIALGAIDPSLVSSIPRSVPLIDGILTLLFVGGLRSSVRVLERLRVNTKVMDGGTPVLIIGAGDAGVMIVREMQENPQMGLRPVGFVDDDVRKAGLRISGLQVLGDRTAIPELVAKCSIGQIVIAMPAVSGKVIREIHETCKRTGIKTRIIPGMFELLEGSVNIAKLRDIAIEDLLRREAVRIDDVGIRSELVGKRVLVTGAGGSIGSELCRQIARYGPAQLILLGHGENSIFLVANELTQAFPDVACSPVIADIRDRGRVSMTLKRYKPELVFHAAAHKHVSLMELNPGEAVTNNIIGTSNLVELSSENDVRRFVLISTDKAVNPTSVMGATKRVAELIVQGMAHHAKGAFITVRFGNVLGSRGSVIPIFREQISKGGPVTVTHQDVKRYFMTIPEAVQLVLQAGTTGVGGEIFMLDMGEPVKIVDLARDLIRLSGLELGRDIDISFTGLRQGEKLFEELVLDDEHFVRTTHEKIFVLKNGQALSSENGSAKGRIQEGGREQIEQLRNDALAGNSEAIRPGLKNIVREFQYRIPDSPI